MNISFFFSVGCVFCDPKEPIRACTRFRARVLLFNIELPITQGFPVREHALAGRHNTFHEDSLYLQQNYFCVQVLLHYQTVSEPATIRKLISVLHKSTGEVLKKKPK